MNHWHHDRLVSALRLLAMLPFDPIMLKQDICEQLGVEDRFFRRLVEAINETQVARIESMFMPDGSGVSYYRCRPTKKNVDMILGVAK